MVIAIDGPAGSGKSTIARLVAKKLGFLYIDTGAMYRALTLKAIERKIDIKDAAALFLIARESNIGLKNNPDGSINVTLDGKDVSLDIRHPRVTKFVSDVAKVREIRAIMQEKQRQMGRAGDSVLDGRDIGTVVFPDADRKFYLDADFSERSLRRHKELTEQGLSLSLKDVESDLKNRDTIDSTRDFAPLKKADDAVYVDTTKLSIEEIVQLVLEYIGAQEHKDTRAQEKKL